MHTSLQPAQIMVHVKDNYRIFFSPGADTAGSYYLQVIGLDREKTVQAERIENFFPDLPDSLDLTSDFEYDREQAVRKIELSGTVPLFWKLQHLDDYTSLWPVLEPVLDLFQDMEQRSLSNTRLTPFTLLYFQEEHVVRFIPLDANISEGKISSPLYRAPELLGKIKAVPSIYADFYSLGMMLYEHFLGAHPFAGLSSKSARREQIVRKLKPLHKLIDGFPRPLSLCIDKMLAKQPANRYKTVYGMRKDFEDFFAGRIVHHDAFVPGMFDFSDDVQLAVPQSYVADHYRQLNHLIFETEERCHKIVFVRGSQLNASDLLTRNYLGMHSRNNTLIASAHVKENAKYLPFYTAALIFKEIAAWLVHAKIVKDERFIRFSQETDNIIIETLIHICPELVVLKSEYYRPVEQPISDTNILYTAVKHLFRFLGTITKPMIISLNNTEYIDKDSTKLFFEILHTADIPHLVFLFQSFTLIKQPKQMSSRNAKFTSIDMQGYAEKYILEMLGNYTNNKLDRPEELARLLEEKCLGKFELMRQFVSEMQLNGSLYYSREHCIWQWDKSGTESIASPLSLEEICEHKQKLLPRSTVAVLQQAAIIGNVFNLYLLSKLTGFPKEQLFVKMEQARELNLVFELTQYSNFNSPENSIFFKFASDRAFRLFYKQGSSIFKDKMQDAFVQTVQYLQKRGNNKLLFEDFFANIQRFAPQLPVETKASIIQVMLSKIDDYVFLCKFNKAHNLLQICFDLLPPHSWLEKYYLTKRLYYTALVLAHNTDTYEELDSLFEAATGNLNTAEDHLQFNLVYINSRLRRNDIAKSVAVLRQSALLIDKNILDEYGLRKSLKHKLFEVLFQYRVLNNELKCSVGKIYSSGIVLAQINVLAHRLDDAVYDSSLDLIIRNVFLDGLSDEYVLPLLIYAKRLLDERRKMSFALCLANFAVNAVSDRYVQADRCRLYYYTNIHPFSERIQSSKQKIKSAIDLKVSLGDLTTAYDLSFDYIFRSLVEGEKLQNLLNETQKIWRIKRKYTKQQLDFDLLTVFYDRIKALYDHQRITDVTENTEKFERNPKLSFWNNLTLLIYFYNTDSFDKALICAGNAQLRANTVENNLPIIMMEFYYCLSLAEDFKNMNHFRRLEALRHIRMRQKELKELAKHSNENFLHMATLLEGTIMRFSGRKSRAIPTIVKAAYIAEKYGNINIQALCYKILAQVALEQKKETLHKQYLVKAYNYYKKWGANTIAERIKLDHFTVFEEMNLRIINLI